MSGGHAEAGSGHGHGGLERAGFLGDASEVVEIMSVENLVEGHNGIADMAASGAELAEGQAVIEAVAAPFVESVSGEGSASAGGGGGGGGGGHGHH